MRAQNISMEKNPNKGGLNMTEKYVITGINKISGEREPVSRPYPLEEARRLRDVLAARQKRNSAFFRLKVEPLDTQLNLRFE